MPGQGAAAFIFDERGRLLLVRENYDRRRYGPPGGRVEQREDPLDAVVREAREEAGIEVAVEHLIGLYRLESGSARTRSGAGSRPAPRRFRTARGEIAEVGWFEPSAIPRPVTNLLHHALADAVAGARGVVRDGLRRLTWTRPSGPGPKRPLFVRRVTERWEWDWHALCLMPNHYHFVIETTRAPLSEGMHRVNGLYAEEFNDKYRRSGHLFGDRSRHARSRTRTSAPRAITSPSTPSGPASASTPTTGRGRTAATASATSTTEAGR